MSEKSDTALMAAPAALMSLVVLSFAATAISQQTSAVPSSPPQLIGAPTRYHVDVERYRFGRTDVTDRQFYSIPQERVDRDTYMRCIDAMQPDRIASKPRHGINGPTVFMPVLAKFVQTGNTKWADACIAMLHDCHEDMKQQVAERKWVWQFEHPSALIPLYRQRLMANGAMQADEVWFRELWLYYCRNLHVWDSEPVEWRGGCHRSMPEAYAKGRAAAWYPDIPEAEQWARYSQLVFGDFWRTKDLPQNDTGYMMGPLLILACGADQWAGDDRAYADASVKRLWDRLLVEIGPDGLINPYGPNGGWNSTADYRIAILERIAAKTRDGRYRFGAHKLLNYLRYQSRQGRGADDEFSYRLDDGAAWLISLAYLFADDDVKPTDPSAGSTWTTRMEAIRIPHTDKEVTERMLGSADPRENFGHICCSWHMSGKEWPDKLILRSGWQAGDLFGLIELHPTSFPSNPGGIMGLNRWGAPFTQIVTSKGASVENRVQVVDVNGTATRRLHPDKLRINEAWQAGKMPNIQSEVTFFKDTPEATYATVQVRNLDGLPVTYCREFVFAKNRFLASRETVTFEECFPAEVAPLWNTHNIGPQLGRHWANTFIHRPVADNGTRSANSPPVDLLVWFAPRPDCELQVVDRLADDPRAIGCPNQVRYLWRGTPRVGEQLTFTQVYYPHTPYRSLPVSNNPNPNTKAAYASELQATAHASGIEVLRDDPDASVLRLELEPGQVEWVVFNPGHAKIALGEKQTSAPLHYATK
ncbi:MAG: hypothetical protein KDA99_25645 [Planctomycetales bacterium]|nr:hypothetical protein [Planctomycetales bacterium]